MGVCREANQLANFVANTTINKEEKEVFLGFNQLPSLGLKILNMNKHQIASVPIKSRIISIDNNGQHA